MGKKVMRDLGEDEKKLITRNITNLEEEAAHLRWLIKFNTLMVDEGLMNNLKEKMRAYKANVRNDSEELKIRVGTIDVLRKQLINGVEVKKLVTVGDE